jgi:uncharacterized protein
MNIKAILILFTIVSIYLGIHIFFYFSFINFFATEGRGARRLLLIILLGLALSVIFLMILVRFNNFFIFRIFYGLSSFWAGFIFILFLAIIIAWAVILILRIFNIESALLVGAFSIVIALVYSFLGLWNTFNPEVKDVEVKIRNLANGWENKKIVQLSDVHLGRLMGRGFAKNVVNKVNALHPDLVLITGDLFDGMGSDPNNFLDILNKLESKEGVYFVTGNHEGYLGSQNIIGKLRGSKITVLENKIVNFDGLQVVGLSYPEFNGVKQKESIVKNLPGFDGQKTNILLYHVPMSIEQRFGDAGSQQTQTYLQPNTDFTAVKEMGIDLQLSGHTHAGQFFPFTKLGNFIFNGFNYGLMSDGDFNLYITSGTGTWGPPIRTGPKSEIVQIKLVNK